MQDIWIESQVSLEGLAESLASSPEAIEFVLLMDAFVAETSFTEELIERLQATLEENN